MDVGTGDLLVRLTIWLSLGAYVAGEAGRAEVVPGLGTAGTRLTWTLGCAFYLAHVLSAFAVEHAWSHTAAYDHTSQQTAAMVGLNWGGGVYVNYAFSALWVSEAGWWWLSPASYLKRKPWIDASIRSVFLFMIVNGAVVFVDGLMRWVGLAMVGALVVTWSRPGRHTGDGQRRSATP